MKLVKRKFIFDHNFRSGIYLAYFNLVGKIGVYSFGFTVYSGIPYPYVDLIVNSSSIFPQIRETKSHSISEEEFYKIIGNKVDA